LTGLNLPSLLFFSSSPCTVSLQNSSLYKL